MTRTWDWVDFDGWRLTVSELMADVLTPRVFSAFLANPPEYVVCDDLSWLDHLIDHHGGQVISPRHLLAERLVGHFDTIRAYHGARPVDPEVLRVQGLRVLDPVKKLSELAALFAEQGLSVEGDVLEAAARSVGTEYREGRIFFEANLRFLLSHCGHYALYGSEYLHAIAARISERHRDVLRRVGTPTVYVCDVPFSLLSEDQIHDYAGTVLQSLFLAALPTPFEHAGPHAASALMILEDLPPDCIVDHFHPRRVFDPIRHSWESEEADAHGEAQKANR